MADLALARRRSGGDDANMGQFASSIALGIALWIGVLVPRPIERAALASPSEATCIPASTCCKICNKGQACGNTCISRQKTCHKDRGCACNASEICTQ